MSLEGYNPTGQAMWVQGVSPEEKLLLLLIAVNAEENGFWPHAEFSELAKMAGIVQSETVDLLLDLEKRGLLKCSVFDGVSYGAQLTIDGTEPE